MDGDLPVCGLALCLIQIFILSAGRKGYVFGVWLDCVEKVCLF